MAFDSLSEKLQNVFKNLRSKGKLTEDAGTKADEDASTETLSFRCKSERCRLMPRQIQKF